jgi:rubrerythrin
MMKQIPGGVTAAKGFEAAGVEAGIKYKNRMDNGELFTSASDTTKWICLNCGYVVEAKEPPAVCPTCMHPKGYFKKSE